MKRTHPDSEYADYQRPAQPGDVWLVWICHGAGELLYALCADEAIAETEVQAAIRHAELCWGDGDWDQQLGRRQIIKAGFGGLSVEWEPRPVVGGQP